MISSFFHLLQNIAIIEFASSISMYGESAMNDRVNILGLAFDNTTLEAMTETIKKRIAANEKTFIVTANPEIVMYANEHVDYMNTLKNADFIVPDGIGIIIGSKLL